MKIRSAAIVFAILCVATPAAGQSASVEKALTVLLNDFLAGASRNDAAVHDRFWADDLIYTRSAGVRIGKSELMNGVRNAPAPKPDDPKVTYTADNVLIRRYGNTAIVAFRLVATSVRGTTASVSHYLNTGTFVRRNGRWQAVAWQSTAVPKTGGQDR